MSIHHHVLAGCNPTPLASYLKALGILRIASEQLDSKCRGWWQDEKFHLLTTKTKDELEEFFLAKYEPTPFVSPWNKGCGFFKANDAGLVPLEQSQAERFERFRKGVVASRELLDEIANADALIRAIKASTKRDRTFQTDEQRELVRSSPVTAETIEKINSEMRKEGIDEKSQKKLRRELDTIEQLTTSKTMPGSAKEADARKNETGYKKLLAASDRHFKLLKEELISNCRRLWRGPHAEWLSSAVVLDEEGSPNWPSLLGTGGNDGNLDFTNTFMYQIGELFDLQSADGKPKTESHRLLQHGLWYEAINNLKSTPIGQFMPGSAGGFNSSTGISGAPFINPWDFVMMMEGAILFSARTTRRLSPNETTHASAPFAIRAHATGYGSTGEEKSQRGEQWMPIWSRPSTQSDVSAMFGEARLQLKRNLASRPIEAVRAITRLGTVRGISSFVRFGYLERNGQSTLAVPLGRIEVRSHPFSHLIDDLASWMDRIQLRARDSYASSRLKVAERLLSDSVLNALTKDEQRNSNPLLWQSVLEACVEIESLQRNGTAIDAGPIPSLNPAWIKAIGDGVEVRLALALASAAAGYTHNGWQIDPIRAHWLPLKPGRFAKFNTSDKRLMNDPRVVISGRDFISDCTAIIKRRIIESEQSSKRILPLTAFPRCGARLDDIAEFIAGTVDDQKVSSLARALMALRWDLLRAEHLPESITSRTISRSKMLPDDAWLMLRLVHLPRAMSNGISIPVEPSIVRLLQSNSADRAIEIAIRRLRSAGIRPPLYFGNADQETANRWAAALVFPLTPGSIQRSAELIDPSLKGNVNA
jgi:CRISPR-associated protein Csx17